MVDAGKMIVIDGIDGSGKGVQTRRLYQSMMQAGQAMLLTREPGGSAAAEDIRKLLVQGHPHKWDSMTELLLMYAARRSHLRDTILPALDRGEWVLSDRFADSSRAFQGIAGDLGLDTVETIHRLVVGPFKPDLILILDMPEQLALQRAAKRADTENRFEKKGQTYQAKVREAFLQIAETDEERYKVINADQSRDQVTKAILDTVNQHFHLALSYGIGQ